MKVVKQITPEGIELAYQLLALHEKMEAIEDEIGELTATCTHEFRELTWKESKDKWMSVGAKCLICNQHFGWRCTKSPDHVCHYYTEEGTIMLIDETVVNAPTDHDAESETDDSCIYCGMPEERK